MVTMLVVAYSVAAYAPRRLALAGLALVALGVTVAIALDPSDSPSNIPPSVVIFVVLPGVVGLVVRAGGVWCGLAGSGEGGECSDAGEGFDEGVCPGVGVGDLEVGAAGVVDEAMARVAKSAPERQDEILDVARMEGGGMKVHLEDVRLQEIGIEVSQTVEPMVASKGLKNLQKGTIKSMAIAWLLTFPVVFMLAGTLFYLLRAIWL